MSKAKQSYLPELEAERNPELEDAIGTYLAIKKEKARADDREKKAREELAAWAVEHGITEYWLELDGVGWLFDLLKLTKVRVKRGPKPPPKEKANGDARS